MTRITSIFTILFLTLNCQAQIAIDSLLSSINSKYAKIGTKEYLSESFTIFESDNKKDRYDIFLDSTNQINEYIGLSIVHYTYDDLNRIKLIEGFNSKGIRSYWDFPEIQIFHYVSDTIVVEMNRIKNEICNCIHPDSLSDVLMIKEINTDTIYNKIRYTISSKDSTTKLSYSICSTGEICQRGGNVNYIYREFDGKNRSKIIHERYYDMKLNLVNGNYNVYTSESVSYFPPVKEYAYSLRELKNGEIRTIKFYNKKGKLVEIRNYGISEGPLNSPK